VNVEEAALCAERLKAALLKQLALRSEVPPSSELESLVLAGQYLHDHAPLVQGLARALAEVAMASHGLEDLLKAIDRTNLKQRVEVRREAAKRTLKLAREVRVWRAFVDPIVRDNLERNQVMGPAAVAFKTFILPDAVAHVEQSVFVLEQLVTLFEHDATHSSSIAFKRGAPTKRLRNRLTTMLRELGLSHRATAELVDGRNDANARDRSRKRARPRPRKK